MGSSSSKVAQTASKVANSTAPKAARKYPTRSPPAASTQRSEAQRIERDVFTTPAKKPEASFAQSIPEDSQPDPSLLNKALNDRLRQLGPITPLPTYSPSSTFNTRSQTQPQTSSSSATNPPINQNADPTMPIASSFRPSPTNPSQTIYPSTSTSANPAISLLTARYRLAEEADREFAETGRSGDQGRSFLDVVTLRQMLVLREQGVQDGEIERRLGIKEGVMVRLGHGVVGIAR